MQQNESNPTDRLIGETEKAWQARKVFLEMGAERSVTAVGKILGKCTETLRPWIKKHKWHDCALRYDLVAEKRRRQIQAEEDEKRIRKERNEYRQNRAQNVSISLAVRASAVRALKEYEEAVEKKERRRNTTEHKKLVEMIMMTVRLAGETLENHKDLVPDEPPTPRDEANAPSMSRALSAALIAFSTEREKEIAEQRQDGRGRDA